MNPKTSLMDYVKVYNDSLSASVCDELIWTFENSQEPKQARQIYDDPETGTRVRDFYEVNVIDAPEFMGVMREVAKATREAKDAYVRDLGIVPHQWPKDFAFEKFRMKKYLPGHGKFLDHVDVMDHNSARRFLTFFWYLNDVEEGGETTFIGHDDYVIQPVKGRLLMFPPLWMYRHEGRVPVSGPKYILQSYLHYL